MDRLSPLCVVKAAKEKIGRSDKGVVYVTPVGCTWGVRHVDIDYVGEGQQKEVIMWSDNRARRDSNQRLIPKAWKHLQSLQSHLDMGCCQSSDVNQLFLYYYLGFFFFFYFFWVNLFGFIE